MARRGATSALGRALVAQGYVPGTREYKSARRTIERRVTETGGQTRGQRTGRAVPILTRAQERAVRDEYRELRLRGGRSPAAWAKAVREGAGVQLRARIVYGTSAYDRQRSRAPRTVNFGALNETQRARLAASVLDFVAAEFGNTYAADDLIGPIWTFA